MPRPNPPRWHHAPTGPGSSGGDRSLPSAACQEQLVLGEVAREFIFVVFSKLVEPSLFSGCLWRDREILVSENPGVVLRAAGLWQYHRVPTWVSLGDTQVRSRTVGLVWAPWTLVTPALWK